MLKESTHLSLAEQEDLRVSGSEWRDKGGEFILCDSAVEVMKEEYRGLANVILHVSDLS